MVNPGTLGQHGVVGTLKENPVALLGDAHGEDVVLFLVDVVQNGLSGAQGHLMLRADAAEENANTKLFHEITSNLK
jgi:hypothetical protein